MARKPSSPDAPTATPAGASPKAAVRTPASKRKAAERPTDAAISMALKRLVIERHADSRGASASQWALFPELRNGTGYGTQTNYIDLFALNLWPSKRHWRIAYELKASRADFLRELAKPEKRAWAMEVANEFWYVCYPGVAKPEEIPQGCGLMVANEALTKLRKVVQAPQREARDLTMTEVAAFARRSQDDATPLFRYAGRELTEADLRMMLAERTDAYFHDRVEQEAKLVVERRLSSVSLVLQTYARDMQRAGIEPPAWMFEGNLRRELNWDARSWARQAFVEGPGLDVLADNEQVLERLARQLEQTLAQVRSARQETVALMARKATESSSR